MMEDKSFIVVTGSDSNYFNFAKDMIESLLAIGNKSVSIGFLDLGLSEDQREWLKGERVILKDPETRLKLPDGMKTSLRQMGYLARPFLRENFPGYSIYAWLDADTWLQDFSGLQALAEGAADLGAGLVHQNERAYRFWLWQLGWAHKHFVLGYGFFRGFYLAWRPMINNGAFAMHVDAPHWERWRFRYQKALDRTALAAPHDQFSLNAAVYLDRLPTAFIPATSNWICDLATPMWDDKKRCFCVPYSPYQSISILHLAGPAKTNIFEIKTTSGGLLKQTLRRSGQVI